MPQEGPLPHCADVRFGAVNEHPEELLARGIAGFLDASVQDKEMKWDITSICSLLREMRTPGVRLLQNPQGGFVALSDVYRYLDIKAREIARVRNIQELKQTLDELLRKCNRIHRHERSEKTDDDWYGAQVCLAAEVLNGSVNFARQIPPDLYSSFETVWLEDVKRLKTYVDWEAAGECWDADAGVSRYLRTCGDMRRKVLAPNSKVEVRYFDPVVNYLTHSYGVGPAFDVRRSPQAHELIARKAHRIWQSNPYGHRAEDDWHLAESYVQRFYSNIMGAMVDRDIACVARVVDAINFCVPFRDNLRIVNAFEAAILMFYVDAESIELVLRPNMVVI